MQYEDEGVWRRTKGGDRQDKGHIGNSSVSFESPILAETMKGWKERRKEE
jgi:hypothetical protein